MTRRALPWVGLLLLAISFIWFLRMPRAMRRFEQRRDAGGAKRFGVVLDPGHGGQDSGAMCGEVMEKDLTLDVALRAEVLLRAAGFRTVLTRSDDRYLSLPERAEVANEEKNSLFVSIHFNDGDHGAASGVETYFATRQLTASPGLLAWLPFLRRVDAKPLLAKSESLARFLQAALVERTQAVDRGTKTAQFYVIRNVRHPAALVEGGFITNQSDMTKLTTVKYREEIARAISEGIRRYREVRRPDEPTLAWAPAPPE
ncbi:MAG TPA: N-acetylmuramoyl-L-alanine amidase [Chthoniobacterales bacterium]|jgi:N-acetylmuramoyl-L-alanine amidase